MIAVNAERAIIDWRAALGVPNRLMSDGLTHLKNETVRLFSKELRVPHHFTLPYTPCSSGAIERLGKGLLHVFRAVFSELRMHPEERLGLLPLVQSVLHSSPSPKRRDVSPLQALTGLTLTALIRTFYRSATSAPVIISAVSYERAVNIKRFCKIMSELHPFVQNILHEHHQRQRNNVCSGKLPNLTEGDFVLVARADFTSGRKLSLRWGGPRLILLPMNDYDYQVKDLCDSYVEDVHGTKFKFYHDPSLDCDAVMPHVLSSETGMDVQRLMRLFEANRGMIIQLRWRGPSPSEDTNEPLSGILHKGESQPALHRSIPLAVEFEMATPP